MHWLLLIAAAVFVSAPACGDYVVAPTGSDAAVGSESAPFATLARAQKAVRQLRAGGDEGTITVLVRGGTYRLDEPVTLLPEDSGTVTGKTIYAAWPGEKPGPRAVCVRTGLLQPTLRLADGGLSGGNIFVPCSPLHAGKLRLRAPYRSLGLGYLGIGGRAGGFCSGPGLLQSCSRGVERPLCLINIAL